MITDWHRATQPRRSVADAEEAEVMQGHDLTWVGGVDEWVCAVRSCGASLGAGHALGEPCTRGRTQRARPVPPEVSRDERRRRRTVIAPPKRRTAGVGRWLLAGAITGCGYTYFRARGWAP